MTHTRFGFGAGWRVAAGAYSLDNDPTSTSKGTSGFGAYALSGESVDVVVGVWVFAAGLTRKATPSACAVRFRDPRRSQCTPGSQKLPDKPKCRGGHPASQGAAGRPFSLHIVEADRGSDVSRDRAVLTLIRDLRRSHRCPGFHASLLCWRMTRDFSRAQSRSFSLARLSWVCLPLANAISAFTLLPFQYSEVGTSV